ncbi:MAG: Na/Pi cotransporter family protein [Eubacteriales bacterium]|nr:Na/Pi cotransporter family protein [Eubacteriales bacterium]
MDVFYSILSMLGGLSLFLYGMRVMGDGLKSGSGGALKATLAKVTNKPIMGFLLGVIVTAMVQSSKATIVLTVGLVGAGFLTYRQSIGIVLGANVGTAITSQIIRLMDVETGSSGLLSLLKSDNLSSIALVLGIIMLMFVSKKKRSADTVGTICMGFGTLFVGLMNMSSAVSSMGNQLSGLLLSFEQNYFLGFLSGIGVTAILQSSSAVIGILQSIASSVGVKFCGIFAFIIGVNMGDCITAFLLCRIGANKDQIKTVTVNLIFNVCSAILLFTGVGILRAAGIFGDGFWYQGMNSGGVANVHGLFRVIPALTLLPFTNLFAQLADKMIKEEPLDEEQAEVAKSLRELDLHLIQNPALALTESEHLINRMAGLSLKNYKAAIKQISDFTEKRSGKIDDRENLIDQMTDACNNYILAVSPYIKSEEDNRRQNYQMRALTAIERIGDRDYKINNAIQELRENNRSFSEEAENELSVLTAAVKEILDLSVEACRVGDLSMARTVEPLEEVIDELTDTLRNRHIERMTKGVCDAFTGITYENIIQSLGRISDHCSDLAVALLSERDPRIQGKEHLYIHNLHHSNNQEYMEQFDAWYAKYFEQLAVKKDPAV